MAGNGAQPTRQQVWAEIMESVERWDVEAKAEALERLVEERVAARLAEIEAAKRQPPKRSQMSAADKSRYIRQHGKIEYDKLPWA